MSLSPENLALVGRVRETYTINADDLNRLLDGARAEARMGATVLPKIKGAELCFSLGWGAGYESALKGVGGPSMPEAWRESPARLLALDTRTSPPETPTSGPEAPPLRIVSGVEERAYRPDGYDVFKPIWRGPLSPPALVEEKQELSSSRADIAAPSAPQTGCSTAQHASGKDA